MESDDYELKACPFCGNIPTITKDYNNFIVRCTHNEWSKPDECGIRIDSDISIYAWIPGKYNHDTNEYECPPEEIERCINTAIEAWNTRAEGANYAD